MACNYLVTANRATAVSASVCGNFTGPNDNNLITAKGSRIEISILSPDNNTLRLVHEVSVHGIIESLRLLRPNGYNKDFLFFMTGKYHVAILECTERQNETYEIITRQSGMISDPANIAVELRNIVIVDPHSKLIGLRLYNGLFKVIPIDLKSKSGEIDSFNIRMEENVVPDVTFLHGKQNPTIAYIHKDMSGTSHLKTLEISLKDKEFNVGPWTRENIASEASFLIPVPQKFGGVIAVALESIVYVTSTQIVVQAPPLIKQSPIQCYAKLDERGSRYLLGDLSGRLFCLILEDQNVQLGDKLEVKDIILEFLGEISIPDSLTYLGNGLVFVGSKLGDSQLIKLLQEPNDIGTYVQVLDTYTNLSPITDMCLVDLEKQGQGQLVTVSGFNKDGSLRIIRNGIGLNEKSFINLTDIKGIWALKCGSDQVKDNFLFITFIVDSFLWRCLDDGDFDNCIEPTGFDLQIRTVLCANVSYDLIIQVTRRSIRLIDSATLELVSRWDLKSNDQIFKATHTHDTVIVAESNNVYMFQITASRKLELRRVEKMESEVACLHLNPIAEDHQLLSVGFWFNMNIVIYKLPDFEELNREELEADLWMVPRSILTIRLDDNYYLLCALGDGSVFYFNLDHLSGSLTNAKKVTLGTYETILRPFKSQSTTSIFVCSDRPTVIYSTNNKLVFSNVNLREVNHMCAINTNHYCDSLALVSDTDLLLGTIDEIQKLHIRTVPLHEAPNKVTHQQSTQTLGLLTTRMDYQDINGFQPARPSASTQAHTRSFSTHMSTSNAKPSVMAYTDSMEVETDNLLIIDQHTFEVLHSHQFLPTEQGVSILSTKLGETEEEYFVVGTAFVLLDEPEPKQGRLIVFKWTQEQSLQQVAELSIKGCPYSLCEFGNKFLAGISASVNLVELNSRRDLHIECHYTNAIMVLFLKRRGYNILMGDLMRSMSLISYKPLEAHFEEVARDFNPAWMTEVDMLDEDHYLGFDQQKNMMVCCRDSKSTNDQDRQQMSVVGLFHLGDQVNVSIPGSLVVQHPSEQSIDIKRTTLFGTITGVIGLVMTIDEQLFEKLDLVQNSMCKQIKSVGRIDHKEWRIFQANKMTLPNQGFIDGDLVEQLLDLNQTQIEMVAKDSGVPVDELVKLVEELSRLH